ncbi:MAG: IS1595 family transposase, partial [Ferruginibacter sp.]
RRGSVSFGGRGSICVDFPLWKGKPVCPHCGSERVYRLSNGKQFKCGNKKTCDKKFTFMVGSIFENTKIPLQKWIAAIYILTQHKKGISSLQLSRDLGITQKSAWFMAHRIRKMVTNKKKPVLSNNVMIDETYVGGKAKNKSKFKRKQIFEGLATNDKAPVLGLLEENGEAMLIVMKDATMDSVLPLIDMHVTDNSVIVTDSSSIYLTLKDNAKYGGHITVNHTEREYVNGDYTTNPVESFFACLKRSIYGIYHQVSVKHLQRYCEETMYRYNSRRLNVPERFDKCFNDMTGHMRYIDLIEKDVASNNGKKDRKKSS